MSRKKDFFNRCMRLLEKGRDMGKLKYKEREELYTGNIDIKYDSCSEKQYE